MKYVTEFRSSALIEEGLRRLRLQLKRPWTLMEVCGGQTHSIMRYGLHELLPPEVELVHGPGCPVCVTPLEQIDRAIQIAEQPGVIFASYGDMLRVLGSRSDLLHVKADGGDVRVVYSSLDALRIAEQNPDRQVVFFAIGFETTAPANAMSVWRARQLGIRNYTLLVSQVRVPPAMCLILSSPNNRVQAFLAAGHVCTVMGYREYPKIAADFGVPIIITGFEPVDLIQGILLAIQQLEERRAEVENAYPRAVTFEGNRYAQNLVAEVFEECDWPWRGIGIIPGSGWRLRPEFADYDATLRFPLNAITTSESTECIAGLVLQGWKKPNECPSFGSACTPDHPLGATMVSSEGACAAYYRYR
jgi:hydrogenase expression/formation protein HypD